MLSIKSIREQYPDGTKDLSDSEIIFRVAKATGIDPEDVAKDFGITDPRNAPRGALGVANDSVINFANTVAGGVGAIADFVAPGNVVSKKIDQFVEDGQSKLSLQERLSQQRFSEGLNTDDIGTQAGAVWERVKDAPLQTAVQAAGNFVVPGVGIKGAQAGARALGVGTRAADNAIDAARNVGPITPRMGIDIGTRAADKAVERVGLGAGAFMGGAMNAGDAAGNAYDLVLQSTGSEELAQQAAREASIAPFAVGALSGLVGAERVLARQGTGLQRGASILKTGAVEGLTEFGEEASAAYSGRKVASMYDASINPMTGVVGQGLMGAVQGGLTGAGVAALSQMSGGAEGEAVRRAMSSEDSGQVRTVESLEEMAKRFRQINEEQAAQKAAAKQAQGNVDLAQANQQANQQQQQQAQQGQQAQTAQQLFDQFGFKPVLNQQDNTPTGQFVVGEKQFFTQGDAENFARAMVEAGKGLSPLQQSAIGKLFGADILPVRATDTAKSLVNRAKGFLDNNQLSSAQSVEEVISRIDSIIENVAPKTDLVGNKVSPQAKMLTELDKLRRALSGEASSRLGEIAEQQMLTVKDKSAKPQAGTNTGAKPSAGNTAAKPAATGASIAKEDTQPGAVTSIPVEQYLAESATNSGNAQTSGGPNGQQEQGAPRLGEVSEQGSAGTTVPSADGNVGPPSFQSVGSRGNIAGQDEQQNDAGRSAGDEQRTVQPSADGANATGGAQAGSQKVTPSNEENDGRQGKAGADASRAQREVSGRDRTDQGSSEAGRGDAAVPGEVGQEEGGRGPSSGATGQQGRAEESVSDRVLREGRLAREAFRRVLEYVFIEKGGAKGRALAKYKVAFYEEFLGKPASMRDESIGKYAKSIGVKRETVKGWSKDLVEDPETGQIAFYEKYGKRLEEGFERVAKQMGMTPSDLYDAVKANISVDLYMNDLMLLEQTLSDDTGMTADVAQEMLENEQTDAESIAAYLASELAVDEDTGRSESGVAIVDSPNETSLAEENNIGESIANTFIRLQEALDAAEKSGNKAAIDRAQKKLDAYLEAAPALTKRAANFAKTESKKDRDSNADADGEQEQQDNDAVIEDEINAKLASKPKSQKKPRETKPAAKAPAANKFFESFMRSYNEGTINDMRRNPDLKDYADYADWLASLTPEQQQTISEKFTADDNPFLIGLNQMNPKAARTKFERMLGAEPAQEVKTSAEQYTDLTRDIPGVPTFEELTNKQQSQIADLAQREQLNLAAVNRIVGDVQQSRVSTGKPVEGAYKAKDLRQEIVDYVGVDNQDKLVVYQSSKEIPPHILRLEPNAATAQGFVYGGRAYLIADNIKAGRGKAVFLHEVGSHMGLNEILGDEYGDLVDQINAWAAADDGSLESRIAQKAKERVRNAKSSTEQIESETIAYFIEEAVLAGVEPSVKSKAGEMMRRVVTAFKRALRALGMNPHFMSVRDVVDLAYGAAHLELSGVLDNTPSSAMQNSVQLSVPISQQRRIDRNLERVPKKARPYFGAISKASSRAMNHLRFTGHILEEAAKTMPGARKFLTLMREQTAMRNTELHRVEKITQEFEKLDKREKQEVNSLVQDSTKSNRWAFTPSWVSQNKAKVDPELARRYDSLSDAGQKVVRDVFAHGYVSMMRLRQGVTGQIGQIYDEQIAEARREGDEDRAAKLETEKATQVNDYQRLFEISGTTPYAPLRRYGKHVVTYRSADMQDAMDVIERGEEEGLSDSDIAEARKFVRQHEGDPKHYQVHFRESAVQAEKLAAELQGQFGEGVQQFTRDEAAQYLYASPDVHGVMFRLRKKANDVSRDTTEGKASVQALNRLLGELHINLLSEQSARQSEHRRAEGTVTGADENMMRAFHTHGLATASMLASLHKGKDVQAALEQFETEAKDRRSTNRERSESLYNEVAARYAMGLDTGDTPVADKLLRYNSAFMLLSRPLYYLQNAMQPWMMSAPYLAGRFGAKAYGTLLSTYTELSSVMVGNRLTADMLEKLPADARRVVSELLERGELNISLDQEMGDRLKGTNVLDNTITKLQGVAERIEGLNRVVTAVAAYRLDRQSGKKSHADSVNYAGEVVYQTHGDYSGFNAPRLMRTQVGRIVTQFRKFQLIQIGLMAKLLRESFGKDMTADEKFVARRALAYTLGTTFMMGGMTALPGFAAVAWVIGKVFGSGDEPDDPEAQQARLRRLIGDPDLADLMLKGIPKSTMGVEGEPIFGGWGNMLSLIPYTKVENTDRSTYSNIALGMSGALIGGLGPKMFTGMGKLADGDITGGLSQVLPTGVGNVVKAMELADKGLTRKAGAEMISPDDISDFTVFMQAIGLRSNELADKEFINRVTTTYDAFYRDESQRVKQQYTEAFKKGDSNAMTQARERWQEINESRRRNGFEVQPYSSLIRAPMEAGKYERRVNRRLENTGRQLAGMR